MGQQTLELRLWTRRRGGAQEFQKDLIIELYNETGEVVIANKVFRVWVSEFQAQAELDANANAVLIQHIKLENEGWERDYEVAEISIKGLTKM